MLLESLMDIVRKASVFMVDDGFDITDKEGAANIVTSSDLAVQDFLCRELSVLLPGCGFICEEEEHHDPDKEYVWVIDPIDGTANYSRGISDCAISVGLKHGDEVVMGVVFIPRKDEMYYAEKGKGAYCNGRRIRVSDRPFENSILCTALSVYRKQFTDACSSVITDAYRKINDIRRFGTASIELCLVACGKCELYFEIRLQPWDYAAGILIIQEAGGCFCNLSGQYPRFDGPDLLVAANDRHNLERLLDIVRKHIPERPYED